MIVPGTAVRLALVPVEQIVITEHQARYPDRVQHYVRLLSDPANVENHPGFIHLTPYRDDLFTILDGHHRYLASIICGRAEVLALILVEPEHIVPSTLKTGDQVPGPSPV